MPSSSSPMVLRIAASEGPAAISIWVRGFGKAMALAPERWSFLAEDERLQPLLTPVRRLPGCYGPRLRTS